MIPPILVTARVKRVFVPVPVVLLWPMLIIALPIAVIVLPFVRIRHTTPRQRLMLPFICWRTLSALRGLSVDVQAHAGENVRIRFW